MKKTKKTKTTKQLKLTTATVRELSTKVLDDVAGGDGYGNRYTGACCQTHYCTTH